MALMLGKSEREQDQTFEKCARAVIEMLGVTAAIYFRHQSAADGKHIVDQVVVIEIEFSEWIERCGSFTRLPERIDDMHNMSHRAAESRRARQLTLGIEHQHRAGIEIKIGLKDGRGFPRARAGQQHDRPVIGAAGMIAMTEKGVSDLSDQ